MSATPAVPGTPTRIVVGSTFGVTPPRGGGQLRLLHLCRALAELCPVRIVALTGDETPVAPRTLAPQLVEERIPKTPEHIRAELELEREAGIPVTDIAFARLHELTPAFGEAVRAACGPGGAVLSCHPYPMPALIAAAPEARLLYDAQDVAADLKAGMLRPSEVGESLLATTREVERACCERAELILPVSMQDGARLRELYGVPAERIAVTPNGVDTTARRFTSPDARREIRARLGLHRPQALFLGSWHEPNLQAVRHVVQIAGERPRVEFVIAGSAGLPFRDVELPGNLRLLGVVPDGLRDTLLAIADVALNPMSSGSGSNIKMLDYLAAGVPVITTDTGARGLDLGPEHVRFARLPEFPEALDAALAEPEPERVVRAEAARAFVEARFDWSAIEAALRARVTDPAAYAGPTRAGSPVSRSR